MANALQAAMPWRGIAAWRIACWIVLLLAAFGGVQYVRHGDYLYLVGALAVIVTCAGAILRQPWARQAMRVVAVLLAVWLVVTAALMWVHWGQFEQQRQLAMSQAASPLVLLVIEQARRSYLTGLVLKLVLLPLVVWLGWALGRPAVRLQFDATRPRAQSF